LGAASARGSTIGQSKHADTRRTGAEPAEGRPASGESTLTVLVALAANGLIAVAKFVAAAITGSSAMLAEAFHSLADTGNEILLLVAQRRSARPPDAEHPRGYGREAYFWALLAAVGVFVAGSVVALREGWQELVAPTEATSYAVAYVVLAVSLVLELVSLRQAWLQLRGEARRRRRQLLQHVMLTSDPTVRAVFAEDSAAVIGNVIALVGVGLHQATGSTVPDGIASLAIGVLLAGVAYVLAARNKDFLVGEPAGGDAVAEVRDVLLAVPGVDAVREVSVSFIGPGQVEVGVRIDVDDGLTGGDVESLVRRVEARLRAVSPAVQHVDVVPSG
jgi:cation diffusion facilitator family transporter